MMLGTARCVEATIQRYLCDTYAEGAAKFMKAKLAKAIAALDRLVNYFIPAKIAADRDARNRAHVFLVSHILGPFIGNVVPITLYCTGSGARIRRGGAGDFDHGILDVSVRAAGRRAL